MKIRYAQNSLILTFIVPKHNWLVNPGRLRQVAPIELRTYNEAMQALEIKKLTKHFGSNRVLKDVSLTVASGEIFGYLGPNGAGKTTTIRCILDFIRPSSGSVSILGHDAQGQGELARGQISYLSSENNLYQHWTGAEHIAYLRSLRQIDEQRLTKLIKELDFNQRPRVKQLSTGNRQKLGIILALMPQSQFLILDEPTRGLDPLLQNVFHSLLKDYQSTGGTVFMSSHNLAEVEEVCDRVAIIRSGKIVTNETIQSLKDKSLYQVRVVFQHPVDNTILKAAGAKIISYHDRVAHLHLRGHIDLLLKALTKYDIDDIEVTRSTLEELFVELYQ